jgi:hypothetical protein
MMDDAYTLPDAERERVYAQMYAPYVALRLARICAWLRGPRAPAPEAFVGHAILVWRLEGKDIDDALTGPVAKDEAEWESFQRSLHE